LVMVMAVALAVVLALAMAMALANKALNKQERDLEQQAKGIEDFVEPYANRATALIYDRGIQSAISLRNQAKEL